MRKRDVYMEAATDGIDGSGTGGAGVQTANPGVGTGDPSLLAQAAAAAGAAANTPAGNATDSADPLASVPDKFKVVGADGKLDVSATLAKVLPAYGEIEKRMSAGAPANADDYKADAVLAKIKETIGAEVQLDDAQAKGFRELAHGLKLSQEQYEGVLGAYFANQQSMVDAAFDNAMAKGAEALAKAWGPKDGDAFKGNMVSAVKAFMTYAPAEMRTQQVMDQIGNHPVVLQVLAQVGKELKEDVRPNAGGVAGDDIKALQNSEAYWNASHPDHDRVVAKVKAFYASGGKNPMRAA